MPSIVQALSIGAIILFLVVAVPVVVDSSTGVSSQTLQLEEDETVRLSDRLELENTRIRPPVPENATFTVRDTETLESESNIIANGSSATYELSGGNVSVEVLSITDSNPETATVTVEYPTTYGWTEGTQLLADHLGLLVVVAGFIVIVMLLVGVIT